MMKKFGMFAPMAMGAMAMDEPQMKVTASRLPPEQPMAQPEKKGLFSPDFADKLSVIGGLLMQNAGNPMGGQIVGNYYQKQENDRLMKQRAIAAEQERMQGREDKQWEWANKPQNDNPTSLQSNYEYLKSLNPALAEQYLESQTTAPPLVIDNGDGTRTVYPAGAIPQASPQQQWAGQPPTQVQPTSVQTVGKGINGQPISTSDYEMVKSNPEMAAQFDAVYGAGTARALGITGGQTSQASGDFQ